MLLLDIDARKIDVLAKAFKKLSSDGVSKIIYRSMNKVGDRTYTQVVRKLTAVTGAQQKRVRHVTKKIPASRTRPEFTIVSRDRHMSLKDFEPRQTRTGISTKAWGKRKVRPKDRPYSFFGPGGHVFVRQTRKRLPIKKLWGPAIPKEMMSREVSMLVNEQLPRFVAEAVRLTELELKRIQGRLRA